MKKIGNKISRLKMFIIDEKYIEYLRIYDNKVAYNKNSKRPYIGILIIQNKQKYFAPLSSPKPKHMKLSNKAIDIWKIDNGKFGIININNMIPCPMQVLTEAIPMIKNDEKYKKLLENQLSSINSDRDILLDRIKRFVNRYNEKNLDHKVLERCCDFELLEKKCCEWKQKNTDKIDLDEED